MHCISCGSEMILKKIGAETIPLYDDHGYLIIKNREKYSEKTGQRQLVDIYVCPKWRWWWPFSHSRKWGDLRSRKRRLKSRRK